MHVSARWLTTAALVGAVLLTPSVAFSIDFDQCGSFECDGNGCLIFRADDGTRYALIVPGGSYTPKYTPGNRACITGDLGCTSPCAGVPLCVTEASRSPWHATSGIYSTSDEFAQGQFLNVTTVSDKLQIKVWAETHQGIRAARPGSLLRNVDDYANLTRRLEKCDEDLRIIRRILLVRHADCPTNGCVQLPGGLDRGRVFC